MINVKVLENKEVSKGIFQLKIEKSEFIKAGQFFMLRAWDTYPLLSRPISVHDFNENQITFLYKEVGEGTKLFSKLKKDDSIKLLGPLGNGFDIKEKNKKIAIVTGGIGIAPMKLLLKQMNFENVDFYAGFKEDIFGLENVKKFCKNLIIVCEKEEKIKKYVIDHINIENYDLIIACGPDIMMKELAKRCEKENIDLILSLESKMACGIGACLGCNCKTKSGIVRTCKEGPVFNARELILNEK